MTDLWRTGRKLDRTIYIQQGDTPSDTDPVIGFMDAPHARTVVDAVNAAARIRALHRQATHGTDCVYCRRGNYGVYDVTWPCDTIRALEGTDQ